ncbi:MAG TPA: MFS transporter [Acidimicrobiales bacterium]|jgi:MFS family permease|nr:MFS transporter [Acidimicrobiales bacterium]
MVAPAAPAPRRGLVQAVEALRYRDFTLFWAGALVSNIGTWMQNITVPFVLYQQTKSASWVGFAAFMQFLPSVLMGPLAGSIADRFPRRVVLLISQALAGLVAFALWGAFVTDRATPWTLVLLVSLNGAVFGIAIASWQAFVTELVPREALLNAITLNSAQFNGARALGPAIGGFVLVRFGPSWAFLVNGLSYVTVLGALAVVRPRARQSDRPQGRVLAQFRESLGYISRHPGIALSLLLVGAVGFFGGPVFQLAPVLADEVFHVGAGAYGVLAGSLGAGAVVGAGILGTLGSTSTRSRLVAVSMLGYGLSLAGLGVAPTFAVAVACMTLAGVGYLAVVASLQTTIQVLVAESLRGRVLAVYIMTFTGAYPLGALLQGWLADRIGARVTVTSAGVILVALGCSLLLRPRRSRLMDAHTHRGEPTPIADPVAAA